MAETRPPLPSAPWAPAPAGPSGGDARTVVFRMAAALVLVLAAGLGFLVTDWYASRGVAEPVEPALDPLAMSGDSYVHTGAGGADGLSAVLEVDAPSPGATVFVNGDSVGVTPLRLRLERPGEQWVLVASGRQTLLDTTLWVEGGGVALLTAGAAGREAPAAQAREAERAPAARQAGSIRVVSAPAGADVLLDGRRVGVTPLTIQDLAPGRYDLTVQESGYESVARRVTIRPGTRYEADLALRAAASPQPRADAPPRSRAAAPAPAAPAPVDRPPTRPESTAPMGSVEILARPWGRIEINGQLRQQGSDVVYRTDLPVGTHRIRASHPSLGSQEQTVIVDRGVTYRLEFDLRGDG